MTNGICKINIEGEEISLLFGMKSVFIFGQKYFILNQRAEKAISEANPELSIESDEFKELAKSAIDNFKLLSYVVYAGLCNYADSKDEEYPDYQYAYLLTEAINKDATTIEHVYKCFNESKAAKDQIEAVKSKTTNTDTKKKKTTTKQKPTQ